MQLSTNFSLSEFITSRKAQELQIANAPSQLVINSLKILATELLQPLRDFIKTNIIITSGYRCLELNRAVGSKDNSQHILGEAVDIIVPYRSNDFLFAMIKNNFIFDQLILEKTWVHVSFTNRYPNRKQCLEIKT
jgi:hypothetical protein